jgi:hypothetical protein
MNKTYIKFEMPQQQIEFKKERILKKILKGFVKFTFSKILPVANPDFENKIDQVKYWLLECDSKTGIPEREIGLSENNKVIMKMPFNRNYGYWTDNNLIIEDFKKSFPVLEISQESFEQLWSTEILP